MEWLRSLDTEREAIKASGPWWFIHYRSFLACRGGESHGYESVTDCAGPTMVVIVPIIHSLHACARK